MCHVETKSIDGETNYKPKQSIKELHPFTKSDEDVLSLQATIECEKPNDNIYKYDGVIKIHNKY